MMTMTIVVVVVVVVVVVAAVVEDKVECRNTGQIRRWMQS